MKKKGQITIFIILGIIILFLVALLMYWKSSSERVRPPVEQLVVDDEVKPIQVYVTDCLSAVSKDALIRMGQNGGYVETPSGLDINPAKPYDSDGLIFAPQIMPYWYYVKPCEESKSGCVFITNPPVCANNVRCVLPYQGQGSMEEQLGAFIASHISSCIADFAPFKDQFDIKAGDIGDIKVDVVIAESTIGFKMEYPLDITIKGTSHKSKMPYFYAEHDISLGNIYKLAQEIRDAQANYTFLERNTLNLISVYSGIDSDMLPPMSGMDLFVAGKKYWIRSEVKEKLESDILSYTMLLQIVNAGNARQILPTGTNPKYIGFEDGLYRSMMIKVSENAYPELDANIYYPPDAEIYLDIGGNEIIKPTGIDAGDDIIMKMINFAMNDYSFEYDLTYPVIVRITDPKAFNGEGYTFSYAMQANIRRNQPVNKNNTIVKINSVPTIDIDNPDIRVNRTITVESYDRYTKEALEGVTVSYKCGAEVMIGETTMQRGKAVLKDRFPFCQFGGELVYEKPGYMGGVIDYDNIEGTDPKNFRVELWPLQEKHIQVYKRTSADINRIRNTGVGGIVLYTTAYTELADTDTVFLDLARVKDDPRETDVPMVGFTVITGVNNTGSTVTIADQENYINGLFRDGHINESIRDEMLRDLELTADGAQGYTLVPEDTPEYVMDFVPGTYSVDAFMMYDGLITIPSKTESVCAGANMAGVCIGQTQVIEYPEQNFTSWITGSMDLEFTLTENDVYSDNTLVFYVPEAPLPESWSDIENTDTAGYQDDKIAFLKPILR